MNTFYHGDCLFVMNHDIEPNSIDLIYLDPPFFTGKTQKGEIKEGVMTWHPEVMEVSYEDSKRFWSENAKEMRDKSPVWLKHIAETRPDFASYLYYMMERLEACHKVLNDKGSIYLHCDWRASHYLKMLMDEPNLFGVDNFQNEVVWHYGLGGSSPERWQRKHDSILFYTKNKRYTFNPIMVPATSMRMRGLDKKDDDVWDIPTINNMAKERVGYPTQKPVALLKKIIRASSNEGNIVLDPFCGCGTAVFTAHLLLRQWIGIDINKSAYETTTGRERQMPLGLPTGFAEANYVSRDVDEVEEMNPKEFEEWVNKYFKATKPKPDAGIDGITPDGKPIQTKTFLVNSKWVRSLYGDAILHPQVPKPCKHVILVSQKDFDDGARLQQSKIQTTEGIKVDLLTPAMMLNQSNENRTGN